MIRVCLFATFVTALVTTQENIDSILPLRSLKPGCSIHKRWVGVVPALPWGAWLTCGEEQFLLIHPMNLVGHVEIKTPEEALDYVRFFTSADSYDLFRLDGMVEILPARSDPARDDDEKRFNEVDDESFQELFHEAEAKILPVGRKLPEESVNGRSCQERQFEVRRNTLWPDQVVRETVEILCEDGFYSIASNEIVIKDASSVGLLYFWQ